MTIYIYIFYKICNITAHFTGCHDCTSLEMVRVKYRYIVVEVIPELRTTAPLNDHMLFDCVTKNVQKYYGDLGIAATKFGLKFKYSNNKTRIAILRVRHKPHRFITSILPLITVIGDQRAKFRILYCGGTMMQSQKFIVKYHKKSLNSTTPAEDWAIFE